MSGSSDPSKCDHADYDIEETVASGSMRAYPAVCSDCGTELTVVFEGPQASLRYSP